MKSDINDLCEAFLAALTNAGYAVKSIENYKQVSNRFKKFCAENGYDTYTVNIGQIFADNVFNEETGAFVGYRNVMYGRFVRLINSFYLQGTFDFSMVTKEKNLPKSIHLIEIYQDYMEHLKTQYSNIGTIGFFQNGMLHLLRYMEDGGILTLKDLAVSDVVNYICSWSQKHQRNVLCILRNIFQHFGREDLYFAVAGIHPYRTKRIVPMFTDNEIMSIDIRKRVKKHRRIFRGLFICYNAHGAVHDFSVGKYPKPEHQPRQRKVGVFHITVDHIRPQFRVPDHIAALRRIHGKMQTVLRQKAAIQIVIACITLVECEIQLNGIDLPVTYSAAGGVFLHDDRIPAG